MAHTRSHPVPIFRHLALRVTGCVCVYAQENLDPLPPGEGFTSLKPTPSAALSAAPEEPAAAARAPLQQVAPARHNAAVAPAPPERAHAGQQTALGPGQPPKLGHRRRVSRSSS